MVQAINIMAKIYGIALAAESGGRDVFLQENGTLIETNF